ncbi:uncharacterized protein STEHIDRAFT_153615 [Stereum hirsutum FP-91666 SS1]|uniref:uncharacterized protein n=1 Tax=Stereum hirsutum (strain FP-91666) TaxID=721885 RepID=UPI000440F8FD|nr:uncharacterized protein STEHIDRAFT_153615 [Stereum hirsutum FP-91666 SS1]EIM89774.1 hypothetical protein STEHIDRAFT_153615 [Stereum hirsutum FP-91666 SS1]
MARGSRSLTVLPPLAHKDLALASSLVLISCSRTTTTIIICTMSQPIVTLAVSPPSTPNARKRARLADGDAPAKSVTLSHQSLQLLAENAQKLLMIQYRADIVRQRIKLQLAQAEASRAKDEARKAEEETSMHKYELERTQLEVKKLELELKVHQLKAKK